MPHLAQYLANNMNSINNLLFNVQTPKYIKTEYAISEKWLMQFDWIGMLQIAVVGGGTWRKCWDSFVQWVEANRYEDHCWWGIVLQRPKAARAGELHAVKAQGFQSPVLQGSLRPWGPAAGWDL